MSMYDVSCHQAVVLVTGRRALHVESAAGQGLWRGAYLVRHVERDRPRLLGRDLEHRGMRVVSGTMTHEPSSPWYGEEGTWCCWHGKQSKTSLRPWVMYHRPLSLSSGRSGTMADGWGSCNGPGSTRWGTHLHTRSEGDGLGVLISTGPQ